MQQASTDTGTRLVRLFHQALVDRLRHERALHSDLGTDQRSITATLMGRAHDVGWAYVGPYAVTHLAAHAAAGGAMRELLRDVDYILHADLAALRAHLPLDLAGPAGAMASVLRRAGTETDHMDAYDRGLCLRQIAVELDTPPVIAKLSIALQAL